MDLVAMVIKVYSVFFNALALLKLLWMRDSDCFVLYPGHLLGRVLPRCRAKEKCWRVEQSEKYLTSIYRVTTKIFVSGDICVLVCASLCIYIYPTPPQRAGWDTTFEFRVFLLLFCCRKFKNPVYPTLLFPYLEREEMDACLSQEYLYKSEMQTASSRIWTQVTVSVS